MKIVEGYFAVDSEELIVFFWLFFFLIFLKLE